LRQVFLGMASGWLTPRDVQLLHPRLMKSESRIRIPHRVDPSSPGAGGGSRTVVRLLKGPHIPIRPLPGPLGPADSAPTINIQRKDLAEKGKSRPQRARFMRRHETRFYSSARTGSLSCHAKPMPSLLKEQAHLDTLAEEESSPLQRSVSVRCRAEAIITHAPSTLYACETHATSCKVYCPPSPSALRHSLSGARTGS
jgi:hypothetical protein